ncbi:uncharacterized protein LOC143208852 [Lasioglossum baleicum]|uniref:uncharacterized protein LOC143208852 n=1 Tax=Lasioglossum baleicum TaxID=434251 RepID=UPI003FCE547B
MLKGNLSSYLDPHNEEESSYVTLSNGPYVYVTDSANAEPKSDHDLVDVYFLIPILCKHCEDYVWGTGKVGVKCKEIATSDNRVTDHRRDTIKDCQPLCHRRDTIKDCQPYGSWRDQCC